MAYDGFTWPGFDYIGYNQISTNGRRNGNQQCHLSKCRMSFAIGRRWMNNASSASIINGLAITKTQVISAKINVCLERAKWKYVVIKNDEATLPLIDIYLSFDTQPTTRNYTNINVRDGDMSIMTRTDEIRALERKEDICRIEMINFTCAGLLKHLL